MLLFVQPQFHNNTHQQYEMSSNNIFFCGKCYSKVHWHTVSIWWIPFSFCASKYCDKS